MTSLPYQATGIAIGGRGVLIEGPPGCGKSSLALMLIDRGAQLVGDDGLLLEQRSGALWALPHPATAGLIEVRNIGLVRVRCCTARVSLILVLDDTAPRFIDRATCAERGGVQVPLIPLWPHAPALHLRAEFALERYGTAWD